MTCGPLKSHGPFVGFNIVLQLGSTPQIKVYTWDPGQNMGHLFVMFDDTLRGGGYRLV